MAKRAASEQTGGGDTVTVDNLSSKQRGLLASLKRPVTAAVDKFEIGRTAVKDLAPKVIGLFNQIKADHPAFSFVEFCRMFDPSVPTHAADRDAVVGYRNHKTYYALDYMRRLSNQRPRGRQGVRESATDALARAIATVLQVIGHEANKTAAVWASIQTEMGFNERVMGRLRKRVESVQPFFAIQIPRGTSVKVGNVIHMERTTAPAAASESAPQAQPGQRVRMAG